MTPEFKTKWIAALRSGKYQQGKGSLRKGNTFCCLGVACDLLDQDGWDGTNWRDCAFDSVGLPFIDEGQSIELADMNDGGSSFETIADYIERSTDI